MPFRHLQRIAPGQQITADLLNEMMAEIERIGRMVGEQPVNVLNDPGDPVITLDVSALAGCGLTRGETGRMEGDMGESGDIRSVGNYNEAGILCKVARADHVHKVENLTFTYTVDWHVTENNYFNIFVSSSSYYSITLNENSYFYIYGPGGTIYTGPVYFYGGVRGGPNDSNYFRQCGDDFYRWYTSDTGRMPTVSNNTIQVNKLFTMPFISPSDGCPDLISMYVTDGSPSGKKCRLGIYQRKDIDGYGVGDNTPYTLLVDAGEISFTSAGRYDIELSDICLKFGELYWLAFVNSSNTQVRTLSNGDLFPTMGLDATFATDAFGASMRTDHVYAALPDPYPIDDGSTTILGPTDNVPLVALHFPCETHYIHTIPGQDGGGEEGGPITNGPCCSLYFDGHDDYVWGGTDFASFHIPLGTDERSFSFWFKPDEIDGGDFPILSYGDNTPSGCVELFLRDTVLVLCGEAIDFVGSSICATHSTSFTANQWYHVLVVFEDGYANFYINGSLDGGGIVTLETTNDESENFYIGRDIAGTRFFHGKMVDFRVYDVALDATDATILYNSGCPSYTDDLADSPVLWFKMDECQGTLTIDWSGNGNGNTGTLMPQNSEPVWLTQSPCPGDCHGTPDERVEGCCPPDMPATLYGTLARVSGPACTCFDGHVLTFTWSDADGAWLSGISCNGHPLEFTLTCSGVDASGMPLMHLVVYDVDSAGNFFDGPNTEGDCEPLDVYFPIVGLNVNPSPDWCGVSAVVSYSITITE